MSFNLNSRLDKAKDIAIKIARVAVSEFSKLPEVIQGTQENKSIIIPPEYTLPKGLEMCSKEASLYFTFGVALDYMTDSDKLWENLRKLYEVSMNKSTRYPTVPYGLFYLEVITGYKNKQDDLSEILRSMVRPRSPKYGAGYWIDIAEKLQARFNSDPRNITDREKSVYEVLEQVEEFRGLGGSKLSAFYLRVMWSLGLFKISDPENIPVAVDTHIHHFTYARLFGHSPNSKNITDREKERLKDFWNCVFKLAEDQIKSQSLFQLSFPYYHCGEKTWKHINRIIPGYLDVVMWKYDMYKIPL